MTDVDEEALKQTIEQVGAEYKAKKKMIEGENKRDQDRVAEKFKDDAKAQKKEIARIEEVTKEKMEELESDFLKVDQDLKEMKPMKIISEATYHDWSLKFGHIFDAGIGSEAVVSLLSRINVAETIKVLEAELETELEDKLVTCATGT